jgi:hypothetical protein
LALFKLPPTYSSTLTTSSLGKAHSISWLHNELLHKHSSGSLMNSKAQQFEMQKDILCWLSFQTEMPNPNSILWNNVLAILIQYHYKYCKFGHNLYEFGLLYVCIFCKHSPNHLIFERYSSHLGHFWIVCANSMGFDLENSILNCFQWPDMKLNATSIKLYLKDL